MKKKYIWLFATIPFLIFFLLTTTSVQAFACTYRLVDTITGPGIPPKQPWVFDISWLDQASHMYYFADSSNRRVDIVDANSDRLVGSIGGFTGYNSNKAFKGPDDIVTDNLHQLWVGNGDSTVKVVNLKTRTIVASISTGGKKRADELAYDARDQILVVTNGADTPAFATFISVTSRKILGKLVLPEATEGLEQPLWDAQTHRFYIAVPSLRQHPGGEIVVVDPFSRHVTAAYPLPGNCHPTGLNLGPRQDLMVGCDGHPVILNTTDGHIEATIYQVSGIDEVWYNRGDQSYYLAASTNPSSSVLAIVDANTRIWLKNIPTAPGSHSVAVNEQNNHIFIPQDGRGITVYSPSHTCLLP